VNNDEKREIQELLEAHERTLAICRASAQTTRDLAWEIQRGHIPDSAALQQTIAEAERVLAELGRVEIAIARLKAALW
jgi:hypothetical protein